MMTSCDDLIRKYVDTSDLDIISSYIEPPKSDMEVTDLSFSPDYKTFTVSTRLVNPGAGIGLTDSTLVRTEVVEIIDGLRHTVHSTPRLVSMENVEGDGMRDHDVRMLILVDKTLPFEQLEQVQQYVRVIRTVFTHERLYLAFMEGSKLSKCYQATDYIIENYFRHSDVPYIYLYRSMAQCREQIVNREGVWKGAKRCVMLTFAAERPYDEDADIPFDPEHFLYEEKLVKRPAKDSTFLAYYVDMDMMDVDQEDDVQCVPYIFCDLNHGEYIWDFDWIAMKRSIYEAFHFDFPDNRFHFVNPDHKVYRGDRKELTLNIYDRQTDKLLGSFTATVTRGRLYRPIIVNGHSLPFVLIQGVLLGLFIFLLVYFVMQVIVPLVRYFIFRHKYVLRYTGPNMSIDNHVIAESCYLCKAPFKPGDMIVAKCEHTMHEECWEENGYHCPEYSDRCKHGSHYFNKYHLFDAYNASFYMKWVLVAVVASLVAWLFITLYTQTDPENFMPHALIAGTGQVPFIDLVMTCCLTFSLSVLAILPHSLRSWGSVLLRTFMASLVSFVAFFITALFISMLNMTHFLSVINALPWMLSSFLIAICSTRNTRIVYNRRIVIISVIIGILSMTVWNVFYGRSELDYRVTLLYSILFYYVSMAISVASALPNSERYFLKVEGAVKTMDIALYKWFREAPDRPVTIGKSVDCSLQLSWDVQSNIEPVKAEIRLIHKVPYLVALERGVCVGDKELAPNHRLRLTHGRSFTIGQTTFTYIEKDR
jgi:hypothetical protein